MINATISTDMSGRHARRGIDVATSRPRQKLHPLPYDVRITTTGLAIYLPSGSDWLRNGIPIPFDGTLTPVTTGLSWYTVPGSTAGTSYSVYASIYPGTTATKAWPLDPGTAGCYVVITNGAPPGYDDHAVHIATYDGESVQQIHRGLIVDGFEAGDVQVETPPWGGGAAVTYPSKSITRSTTGMSLHGFQTGSAITTLATTDRIPLRRVVSSIPTLLWATLDTLAAWVKDWILSSGSSGGIDDDLLDDLLDETDGRYWRTGDTDGSTTKGAKIYDNSPVLAVDITNRKIYDKAGDIRADFELGYLHDASDNAVVKWLVGQAIDASSKKAVDWLLRKLFNSTEVEVLNWETKYLKGSWTCDTDFTAPVIYAGGLYVDSETAEWQTVDVVTAVAVDGDGHVTSVTTKTVEYLGKASY